jgi:phosphatidate cytidylyltransferase
MKLRIISGVLGAIALVLLIYRGPAWLITAVVVVLAILSYREFDSLFFENQDRLRLGRMTVFLAATILSMKQSAMAGMLSFWFSFAAIGVFHLSEANRSGDFFRVLHRVLVEWMGFTYAVSLMGFVMPIRWARSDGADWLLLFFMIVFVGDSVAYFCGRVFGKHPLALLLSPKKTWEGAVAGLLGSISAVGIWYYWIYSGPSYEGFFVRIFFLTVVTAVLAQLGDLLESLFKRARMQKDSGQFLPGHGGLLDRVDGLALSAPFYYGFVVFGFY